MDQIFKDREDAGLKLAMRLKEYKDQKNILVLALPRGGVVTGYAISRYLNVPLDIVIVRKLGFPGQPEFGIGAVSETGTIVLNQSTIDSYEVPKEYIAREVYRQKEEIARRVKIYRSGEEIPEIEGKTIILVDDGVATGATLKAAISTLRGQHAAKLAVALPVAPYEVAGEIEKMVDEFVCLETPVDFVAVGAYYHDFTQVSDEAVVGLLARASG